jgi:uncharacterized protein DUF4390
MRRVGLLVALLMIGGAQVSTVPGDAPAAAAEIKVTPLVAAGRVAASFVASGAFTTESRDVVKSGLPLTFTYEIDLRRPSSIWFDRTLGSTVVSATAKFDNLTGVYQVTKQQDGRVVSSSTTSKDDEMQVWTTAFEDVPVRVTEQLESNAEYYFQVRLQARPHLRTSLWPFGRDDGVGRADFTFIK